MGKNSTRENKSVYQLARENLGYTREKAAEMMSVFGMTEYRLVKIEEGTVQVQPEDITAIAKAYNMPELRNFYCTHDCSIGKIDVPEITLNSNIHEILVNMVVTLEAVNNKKSRLMEILADGKIQSDEVCDFETIQAELEKISMTVEALQLWCEKMKVKKS